jgi:hypothetical protein
MTLFDPGDAFRASARGRGIIIRPEIILVLAGRETTSK